jgi:uncharacterized protein YbjQ (UPF0145 family)
MLEDSRKEAMDRMIKNANTMGANAVIMTRFDSGEAEKNMTEIFVYGNGSSCRENVILGNHLLLD